MKKLIFIILLFPCLLLGQTQVMAPFFTVFGTLKADSIAARALVLTGGVTVSGTLSADSLASRALYLTGTINSDSLAVRTATVTGMLGADSLSARALALTGELSVTGTLAAGGKLVVSDSLRVEETSLLKGDVTANTKLVVNDSLRVEETAIIKGAATISGLAYPTVDGTNGQLIQTDGSGTLSFTTYACDNSALWTRNAGSGYTYLTNADNVGIGTNSPTESGVVANPALLHIAGPSHAELELDHTDAGNSSALGVLSFTRLHVPAAYIWAVNDGSTDAAYMEFATKPTGGVLAARMRIGSAGGVGINDNTLAGTYDLEIGDSLYTGGNIVTPANIRAAWGKFTSTGTQLRLGYNAGNGTTLSTGSGGDLTIAPSGGDVIVTGSITANAGSARGFTLVSTNDVALELQSTDNYTGIKFNDGDATDNNLFYRGANATFDLGGDGANVAGKKLHINGGVTIGSTYGNADNPTNGLRIEGSILIGDAAVANTYDITVRDSVNVKGNLLVGSYAGAYSYVHPGGAGFTASSTQDIKEVGPEKEIPNILELVHNLPIKEWNFDAEKIKEKFKDFKPSGFDTLAKSAQDSIKAALEAAFNKKANEIAKYKHYTPVAEDWYVISQHFGGSPKEINSEHVMWAMMIAIKQLNAKVDSLELRLEKLEKK